MTSPRVPLAAQLAYTAWMAVWVPLYWRANGWTNFLWLCDFANFGLLAALWAESAVLASSQLAGVLLIQTLWTVDFLGRLLSGHHLLGGTEYMFDPAIPPAVRLASLFHVATPPLLLWALRRLGYDRRALPLQIAIGWAVLCVSLAFGPERDLNWVWGPYERPQAWVSPWLWFAGCLAGFPLLLWWPTHLALSRWAGRARPSAT